LQAWSVEAAFALEFPDFEGVGKPLVASSPSWRLEISRLI
jgi:hypothetical protein